MATPQPPIEIPLGSGPSQATGRLFRGPNALESNQNGRHDQAGYLVKERGFTRLAFTTTTHGETPEAVAIAVAVDRGELVVIGHDNVYGVAANTASVDGAALVRRGPSLRGAYSIGTIHAASLGQDT
jgi:hypothetical protein